jgi:hypothetical protein
MTGFTLNTDFSTIQPSEGGGRSYFPVSDSKGWLCAFEDDEEITTNKGTPNEGKALAITVKGLEGAVTGKLHTMQFNIVNNQYPKTVEIAISELSAMAHVTGHTRVGKVTEWKGIPFRLVIIEETGPSARPGQTKHAKILTANGQTAIEAAHGVGAGGQQSGAAAAFGGGGNAGNQAQNQPATGQGGGGFGNQGGGGSTAFNPDTQGKPADGGFQGEQGGGFNGGGAASGGNQPGWAK